MNTLEKQIENSFINPEKTPLAWRPTEPLSDAQDTVDRLAYATELLGRTLEQARELPTTEVMKINDILKQYDESEIKSMVKKPMQMLLAIKIMED